MLSVCVCVCGARLRSPTAACQAEKVMLVLPSSSPNSAATIFADLLCLLANMHSLSGAGQAGLAILMDSTSCSGLGRRPDRATGRLLTSAFNHMRQHLTALTFAAACSGVVAANTHNLGAAR